MNPYYLTESLGYPAFGSYSPASGASSPNPPSGPGSANPTNPASTNGPSRPAAGPAATAVAAAAARPSSSSGNGSAAPAAGASATSGPLVHPHQDLNDFLESFWTRQMDAVEGETPDFKTYNLPLARIKKVMKSDEDVKMISAEAPIMFSKACEIFISELTCRAWLVAEGHKRRTLQKSDVAAAIAFSDVFDFLIDIVPRDDGSDPAAAPAAAAAAQAPSSGSAGQEGEHDASAEAAEWTAARDEPEFEEGYEYDAEERDNGEALYSEYVEGEAFA